MVAGLIDALLFPLPPYKVSPLCAGSKPLILSGKAAPTEANSLANA